MRYVFTTVIESDGLIQKAIIDAMEDQLNGAKAVALKSEPSLTITVNRPKRKTLEEKYPLKIETVRANDGSGFIIGFYSKGHHEEGPFRFACELGHHLRKISEQRPVKHLYANMGNSMYEHQVTGKVFCLYPEKTKPNQFPVTYIYVGTDVRSLGTGYAYV